MDVIISKYSIKGKKGHIHSIKLLHRLAKSLLCKTEITNVTLSTKLELQKKKKKKLLQKV